mmetsp:Transcript_34762/g.108119  ORF Transcript_34762/g.108119 Transcript_34762/m.108119 type:complete len:221 (+) Transcript_34762:878-1540(+)
MIDAGPVPPVHVVGGSGTARCEQDGLHALRVLRQGLHGPPALATAVIVVRRDGARQVSVSRRYVHHRSVEEGARQHLRGVEDHDPAGHQRIHHAGGVDPLLAQRPEAVLQELLGVGVLCTQPLLGLPAGSELWAPQALLLPPALHRLGPGPGLVVPMDEGERDVLHEELALVDVQAVEGPALPPLGRQAAVDLLARVEVGEDTLVPAHGVQGVQNHGEVG